MRESVSVKDFGAVGNGVTDDTTALQAAVNAAAGGVCEITQTLRITAAIDIPSNTTIYLAPGSYVTTSTIDISHFTATGKVGVSIVGNGKIIRTVAGTAAYIGGVTFNSCTDCHVIGPRFEGMQWAGVYLNASSRCTVRETHMSGWLGAVQDSCDVCIYGLSNDNKVIGNWLRGNGDVGVLIQDPFGLDARPQNNLVYGNTISEHKGYGVAVYIPARMANLTASIALTTMTVTAVAGGTIAVGQGVANSTTGAYYGKIIALGTGTGGVGTYTLDTSSAVGSTTIATVSLSPTNNKLIANDIFDIQGSVPTNRSSGAGIYMAGAGVGGTIVEGGTIRNCCVQTLNRNLTPACVGINSVAPGAVKPQVSGVTIDCGAQGDGISVVSCPGGAVLTSIVVSVPVTSNGSGVGGGPLVGSGIRIENSFGVDINGPDVTVLGTGNGLLMYANSVDCSEVCTTGGTISAAQQPAVAAIRASSAQVKNASITGTRVKMTGANYAISLANCNGFSLSGVNATAISFEALRFEDCTITRVNGGSYLSGAFPYIRAQGVCTGSYIDDSVYWGTSESGMSNAATGCNVEWRSNQAPITATWAVGDTTKQSVPVVGQPKGWRCTVAGAPGTWVSEGNL
jgi:hypothetical protein